MLLSFRVGINHLSGSTIRIWRVVRCFSEYGEFPRYKGIDLDTILKTKGGKDALKYSLLPEIRLA